MTLIQRMHVVRGKEMDGIERAYHYLMLKEAGDDKLQEILEQASQALQTEEQCRHLRESK